MAEFVKFKNKMKEKKTSVCSSESKQNTPGSASHGAWAFSFHVCPAACPLAASPLDSSRNLWNQPPSDSGQYW